MFWKKKAVEPPAPVEPAVVEPEETKPPFLPWMESVTVERHSVYLHGKPSALTVWANSVSWHEGILLIEIEGEDEEGSYLAFSAPIGAVTAVANELETRPARMNHSENYVSVELL